MLLTVKEAGDRLGVGRSTVYRLIHSGDLRVVNVATHGRSRIRIRLDDLQAFIDARTHDPIDPATVLDEAPRNKSVPAAS